GNPSLNHRYRKGFYSLFKTLQQNPLKDSQERKVIDRRKEVYNFYKVEASLRYGIGKLSLDGKNIPQNKPYIGWKSDALEVSKKLSMEEDELQ
ncbi:hypothetical protein ACK4D4_12525, partial [Enterococcus hirae]|nr:hypothetical protein [Enterococcus hirae]